MIVLCLFKILRTSYRILYCDSCTENVMYIVYIIVYITLLYPFNVMHVMRSLFNYKKDHNTT